MLIIRLNKSSNIIISDKAVVRNGALIAVATVFAYSLVVMLYVIIYSSIIIHGIMPTGGQKLILLASGISVAYSVVVFSLMMALLSSSVGFVVAIALEKSLLHFNPLGHSGKALLISCTTALATAILVYLLLHTLLTSFMTFAYVETFSFWFLFPAIIFSTVCVISGIKLNKALHVSTVKN